MVAYPPHPKVNVADSPGFFGSLDTVTGFTKSTPTPTYRLPPFCFLAFTPPSGLIQVDQSDLCRNWASANNKYYPCLSRPDPIHRPHLAEDAGFPRSNSWPRSAQLHRSVHTVPPNETLLGFQRYKRVMLEVDCRTGILDRSYRSSWDRRSRLSAPINTRSTARCILKVSDFVSMSLYVPIVATPGLSLSLSTFVVIELLTFRHFCSNSVHFTTFALVCLDGEI